MLVEQHLGPAAGGEGEAGGLTARGETELGRPEGADYERADLAFGEPLPEKADLVVLQIQRDIRSGGEGGGAVEVESD